MSKKDSNFLISAFYIGVLIFRGASIFLTAYFEPKKIISVVFVGCVVCDAVFVIFGSWSVLAYCLSTIGYNVFRSPVAGVIFAILNQSFTPSTRQTSIIFLVGILGEAIHPGIVSQFIDYNPNVFIYYIGILIAVQQCLLISLPFISKMLFKKASKVEEESASPYERRMSRLNSIAGITGPRGSIISITQT